MRGSGADNRLIDCALIDARLEARRGRGAHVRLEEARVLDRVPTISLRMSERAGDLSRKIYSFIHAEERRFSAGSFSRLRPIRGAHEKGNRPGLSPVPPKILLELFDIRVEGLQRDQREIRRLSKRPPSLTVTYRNARDILCRSLSLPVCSWGSKRKSSG